MTYFTDEQISLLLKPIHPNRVANLRGLSYIEGYDCRAELTRVFGFGRWSEETMEQSLVVERETKTKTGGNAWYVVYRTRVRLTIFSPEGDFITFYDGAHVGESTHPVQGEAHGNALTNSQTYALRRCAINLGDQFGLSLYNKGSMEPIVRWTLVRPEEATEPVTTEDVPVVSPEEPEFAEEAEAPQASPRRTPKREVPSPPPLLLSAIITSIADATTVEELRKHFKDAGTLGKLQEEVTIPGTEEKITVEKWLFRRVDELETPKSPGNPEENPGESDGAE